MTAATRDVIVTTMLLAMTVASLGAVSPAEKPAAPSTAPSASDIAIAVTTTATAPAEISLPSFGLSVPLPQGYARDMDTEKSAVMIVPAGSVGRPQVRAIMVNVMPRQQPTFERAVEEALKTSGGLMVARKDAMWGDLKATELVPAPPAAAAAPPGKIARVSAPNPSDGAAGAFGPSATAKPAG